jgi:hypothetical protein
LARRRDGRAEERLRAFFATGFFFAGARDDFFLAGLRVGFFLPLAAVFTFFLLDRFLVIDAKFTTSCGSEESIYRRKPPVLLS